MEEKQITPQAQILESNGKPFILNGKSSNSQKLLLVDFKCDSIKYPHLSTESGAKTIKVREDLLTDLTKIKQYLNKYDIPFSCQSINVSLSNQYISDLARVGLEIHLNPNAALTPIKNPEYSDYYVCPEQNFSNKLRIYGYVPRSLEYVDSKYKPAKMQLDVYDIRDTFNKRKPDIYKIYKPLLDITKIFEDFGFKQKQPEKEFFLKSDNLKSNWFIFYKPSKINIGYTYKELLSTVYENNNEPIWASSNKIWDGEKFI